MINDFMNELKQLCEKHGVRIVNAYDELVYLSDKEGNQLSEEIDFDKFTTQPYVEPVRNPNAKPMTMQEMNKALKKTYENMAKTMLEENHAFSQFLKK